MQSLWTKALGYVFTAILFLMIGMAYEWKELERFYVSYCREQIPTCAETRHPNCKMISDEIEGF